MFDNVRWDEIINNILCYIKNWKYLIVKFDISKTSYSDKYYYSKNGNDFVDLHNIINNEESFALSDNIIPELEKITEKFNDHKEKMFITMKVEKTGSVKIIYRDIKEGNKISYDESFKYLQLSENDKK